MVCYFHHVKVLSKKIIISSCAIMGYFEKHHVKLVDEGKKVQCPHCEHKATKKSGLQTHIRSVHEGQRFQCPQCDYKATLRSSLQTHIRSVHGGQRFQCPQCDYKATQKGNLRRHIKSDQCKKVKSSK